MQEPTVLGADERVDVINESITLVQRQKGLTFGTDAFLLSAFCRPAPNAVCADLGCGTGVIALLLAARKTYAHIYGVEVQETFFEITRRNLQNAALSDTVTALLRDVRDLTPKDFGRELDVVVANPPYMRADSGYASPFDEKQIARHEVMGNIDDFAAAAARCLKYGGVFYSVFRPDRLCALLEAHAKAGLAPKRMVFVHDHAGKEPSMVLTEAKKGGAEGLRILPPLFLHETVGAEVQKPLSPAAAAIYEKGRFD